MGNVNASSNLALRLPAARHAWVEKGVQRNQEGTEPISDEVCPEGSEALTIACAYYSYCGECRHTSVEHTERNGEAEPSMRNRFMMAL